MKEFKGKLNDRGIVSFNQSLFLSQACFNDVVWVVDLSTEMVDILYDTIEPSNVGKQYSLEETRSRIKSRYPGENRAILNRYTVEYLSELKETVYFNNPTFVVHGKRFKLRQAITPEITADGKVIRVYITCINIQNFAVDRKERTDIYKTVSMILSRSKSFEESISETLNFLGRELNISRIYIYENDDENPEFCDNTFEWCADGIESVKDKNQHISYKEYGFDNIFSNAQLYSCADVNEIRDTFMREMFQNQGIKAFINYAFYNNGQFAGFIGIDDCFTHRTDWNEDSEEIEIFTFVADLLTTFLIKERNFIKATEAEKSERQLRQKELSEVVLLKYFVETYTSAYMVNLKGRSFEILHMAHEFQKVFTMNGGMEDMKQFVETHVHPDDREFMRQMINPDYVRERLKTEKIITFTMREKYDETEKTMHVTIVRGWDHNNCAIGFMDVTLEIQKEKEINEKLERANEVLLHEKEQARIIGTLGSTFSSVYYTDIKTKRYRRIFEVEKSVMSIPESGNWIEAIALYYKTYVNEDYAEYFKFAQDENILIDRLKNKEHLTHEYLRKDGGWRRAYFVPSNGDDGELDGFIFAAQNISESKKRDLEMQKALQDAYKAAQLASSAKTTFLSNMSHDIRTPMNAIIGMAAIAGSHLNEPDRVADCLGKINSSSRHLLGLINQVLDMSKIESGKIDLSEENFELSNMMDEVVSMNYSTGKAKGHSLSVKSENIIHDKVIGDRTRLEQVFNNLLSNAIKYTPDGGHISISITENDVKKASVGCYEVVVRDTGIGMTNEFLATIFEPFSRAVDSIKNNIQGTGLGMPIARNIVRMMDGDIKVESEVGKGSKFIVTFTLKLQSSQHVNYEDFYDLPVLVVDDDVDFCESTCSILDSLSMKSEYVTSGEKAIERTLKRHEMQDDFYAILMDWQMPGMDGIETTRKIRKQVGGEIPIIVLTSYDWSDIEQEAKEAGINGFISKPIFKSKIIDVFNEFGTNKQKCSISNKECCAITFNGKRILIAEDNDINREIICELLADTGIEIDTAEDGSVCVDMYNSKSEGYYSLIFMDIQMPVMNGYDATRAIRASDHLDAKTIPIIAMTANAFSSDVRDAINAGMNEHIAKPIDMNIVLATMQRFIK